MNKIAIIICNYNKKNDVIRCIESVFNSSFKSLDLYVVDNASTDGSVKEIKNTYSEQPIIIENKVNLGGAGGFNSGIKVAVKHDYQYIMLLDNDVILNKEAISASLNLLERNPNICMVGSKICSMTIPDQVQEFGAKIDFDTYGMQLMYKGYLNADDYDGELPEIIDCDYVAACSMMVRVSAIKEVGLMDENNFIYWDDIDWGYRFKLHGYRVVAYSQSVAWHRMGAAHRTNTFGTYYFWRNRVHFFMKYCTLNQLEIFSEKLFDEIFQAVYACNYIGKYSSARTILMAVDDALNGVRGEAGAGRILEVEVTQNRLTDLLKDKNNLLIIHKTETKVLRDVVRAVTACRPDAQVTIASRESDELKYQFPECKVSPIKSLGIVNSYDVVLETCAHIFDKRGQMTDDRIYVDRFMHVVISDEDRSYVNQYDAMYKMLKNIWFPVLRNKIINKKRSH